MMAQPVVETTNGKLRGTAQKNLDGENFYCFYGIPYVKAALGDSRFKAPQPADSWTGIKDAASEGPPFLQKDNVTQTVLGVEDACHLNVFTKKISSKQSELLPVMVWIHGGAFVEGSNSVFLYGPDFLLTENIVLVAINYRIGFLGFLSFEDPSLEVYGNAGLKDQVEALKWVQRNIRNFGGDPNNVTLFGQSAGGVSIHYLMMNPSTKGLFHKAIMQSGVSQNFWAKGVRYTNEFKKFIGKEKLTDKQFLDFLRGLTLNELFEYQVKYFETKPASSLGTIGPVEEIPNETAFMTEYPLKDLNSGNYNKIPIMLGYTSNECILFGSSFTNNIDPTGCYDFRIIANLFNLTITEGLVNKINNKLKGVYPAQDDVYLRLSDVFFVLGILIAAKKHSEASDKPVYLYRMSLDRELNLFKRHFKLDRFSGVCHGDDLGYLFRCVLLEAPEKGTIEDVSVRRFVKLWTNFAKYGNPTPEESELGIIWKPYQNFEQHFLDIDEDLTMKGYPEKERIKVWRDILQMFPETADLL